MLLFSAVTSAKRVSSHWINLNIVNNLLYICVCIYLSIYIYSLPSEYFFSVFSVQLKMVSMRLEKPICALPHLLEVSPVSPLKQCFQSWNSFSCKFYIQHARLTCKIHDVLSCRILLVYTDKPWVQNFHVVWYTGTLRHLQRVLLCTQSMCWNDSTSAAQWESVCLCVSCASVF